MPGAGSKMTGLAAAGGWQNHPGQIRYPEKTGKAAVRDRAALRHFRDHHAGGACRPAPRQQQSAAPNRHSAGLWAQLTFRSPPPQLRLAPTLCRPAAGTPPFKALPRPQLQPPNPRPAGVNIRGGEKTLVAGLYLFCGGRRPSVQVQNHPVHRRGGQHLAATIKEVSRGQQGERPMNPPREIFLPRTKFRVDSFTSKKHPPTHNGKSPRLRCMVDKTIYHRNRRTLPARQKGKIFFRGAPRRTPPTVFPRHTTGYCWRVPGRIFGWEGDPPV